jgi:hypothetical protein
MEITMEITRHQLMTASPESESLFMRLWQSGNDAGEGFIPDFATEGDFMCHQGELAIFRYDRILYGVGYCAEGPWAVTLGRLVD